MTDSSRNEELVKMKNVMKLSLEFSALGTGLVVTGVVTGMPELCIVATPHLLGAAFYAQRAIKRASSVEMANVDERIWRNRSKRSSSITTTNAITRA